MSSLSARYHSSSCSLALCLCPQPSLVNIDKSGANKAGIKQFNQDNKHVEIRQCKYLNNIVEQDHRRIKRITLSTLGFKNFHCAQSTLTGIEVAAMTKKG